MLDVHALQAAAFTVAVEGDEFRFIDLTDDLLRVSGMRREDQVGKRPQDCFAPHLADTLLRHYRECASSGAPIAYEVEYVLPSGYLCWRTTLVPVAGRGGSRPTMLLGICMDISADRIAERANVSFQEKMSLAIGALDGGFWVYDVATDCFETSRPLAELIAGPGRESLSLCEYLNHIHAEDLRANLVDDTFGEVTVEYRVVTFDGGIRWLKSKRRQILDDAGAVVRVVALVLDVTDQKTALHMLESEAATDGLTRLINRRAFDRIVAQSWEVACLTRQGLGIMLIDLDGFKPVNDRHGHRAGDEVLRLVARRIARAVRSHDVVARVGGDEFAILVRDHPADTLELLKAKLERAFAKPFRVGGAPLRIGASFGSAQRQDDDKSIEAMIDRADRALYAGKRGGSALCA